MYTSLLMVLGSCCTGQASDDGKRPLLWAADPTGGVPYIFKDENDKYVGFEVDIAAALSKELGRPIIHTKYEFESLFEGLERKDFDFAMNGLEIVPKNLERASFTRPYYIYQLQLVVRDGDSRFSTLEMAKDKDAKIGTLGGSAAENVLRDMKIEVMPYQDQDPAFDDLKLGRTDGVLMDLPICTYYALSKLPSAKVTEPSPQFLKYARRVKDLQFAGSPFAQGYYGIAVRKGNEALVRQLDGALDKLLREGEIKRILQRWDLWSVDQYALFENPSAPAAKPGQELPYRNIGDYLPLLLQGAWQTIKITGKSMVLAVLLALPICVCRMYGPAPIRWLAGTYVEFFRGIPVLFLLFFFYYGLPHISTYLNWAPENVAVLAFGLNYAAYEVEVYRAAIGAVPTGQWEAAASLGMTPVQTFWRIILPQSVRGILPPMTNDLVSLFKDTSLVAAITIADLNYNYRNLYRDSGAYLPIAVTTAGLYLFMSVPLGYLSRYLEKRWGAK